MSDEHATNPYSISASSAHHSQPRPRVDAGGEASRIVVLLPAHNEQATLPRAIASVRAQHRSVQQIITIADNCTDRTAEVARECGCHVIETVDNAHKKAGALNQVLPDLLAGLDGTDLVMVMDSDSVIPPDFTEIALDHLLARPDAGAIGGVFYGNAGGGLVGALQRSEYARYAREIARRQARAVVLTGTATLFRVSVLREVAEARGPVLPGQPQCVYAPDALTEDNEITLAIKHLGWTTLSPRQCRVSTEIMPTWTDLAKQRLRWQRGALENLRDYGLTRVTFPYAIKQCSMYAGIGAVSLMLFTSVLFVSLGEYTAPSGLLWIPLVIFVAERVATVRRQGLVAVALAAPLVIEFAYDLFQQWIFLRAAADILRRRTAQWHHLTDEGT
jgi:biofilm PGA synthesis N-glycosyltransferase PgaC